MGPPPQPDPVILHRAPLTDETIRTVWSDRNSVGAMGGGGMPPYFFFFFFACQLSGHGHDSTPTPL